jgi:hypothetical protein
LAQNGNKYELTESRKALYFKALFQETTKFFPNIKLTYEHMYRKYFHNKILNNYTLTEKNFIYKCSNNYKLLIDIYKNEYIKYSKWISLQLISQCSTSSFSKLRLFAYAQHLRCASLHWAHASSNECHLMTLFNSFGLPPRRINVRLMALFG